MSTVQANFKLLEVKTGKVIASGDFKFTMRSTEIPASEKRDWTAADYTNALLDRAVAALTGTILEQVDPVLVAGVDDGAGLSDARLPRRRKDGEMFSWFMPGARGSCIL